MREKEKNTEKRDEWILENMTAQRYSSSITERYKQKVKRIFRS